MNWVEFQLVPAAALGIGVHVLGVGFWGIGFRMHASVFSGVGCRIWRLNMCFFGLSFRVQDKGSIYCQEK